MNPELNKFVGIPWLKGGQTRNGADCWGIVVMALKECYNITITTCTGIGASGNLLSTIIENIIGKCLFKKLDNPVDGCICLMYSKQTKRPEHVGLYLDKDLILHSLGGVKSNVSSIIKLNKLKRMFDKLEYYGCN